MIEKIFNGKRSSFAVFVMLTSIIFTGTVSAATLSVNADGSMDYTSIQAAINAAGADDTILVYSGTYYEQVAVNKQLILRGMDNGGKPIINAGGTGSAITLSADGITLDGFTVEGGYIGIYITSSNNLIKNNTVQNNIGVNAVYRGGRLRNINTPAGNGIGVSLSGSNNNIFENNTIQSNIGGAPAGFFAPGNGYGIYMLSSTNNTFTNSTIQGNIGGSSSGNGIGVYMLSSTNNTFTNSAIQGNIGADNYNRGYAGSGYGVVLVSSSNNNALINNDIKDNVGGHGYTPGGNCNNVLAGAGGNGYGVSISSSTNNTLANNTIQNNSGSCGDYAYGGSGHGIYIDSSTNNVLASNIIQSNSGYYNFRTAGSGYSVYLSGSNNNTLRGNMMASSDNTDKYYGISLSSSSNNMLSGNNVTNNYYGISLSSSSGNSIYNNYFNNDNDVYISASASAWNTTKTIGMNIVGGPYLGGNFWANPSGTGFSQTCTDADWDGICDLPYTLDGSNIDYLPLSMNFTLDVVPPTTTITLSGTLGNNGWYTSDVQATLNANDNEGGSGVKITEYSFDGNNWNQYNVPFLITNEGIKVLYYKSTDNAGNVESTKTQTLKIDKTPPLITINTPFNGGVYLLNQTLIADWSATDSLSDISSVTGTLPSGATIDTGTVRTKTFTVVATDNAGNTATQTASYTIAYNFLGILQPIRTDNSSIFKLGRTVPVKFRIADANSNYVSTAVANVTYQFVTDGAPGSVEIPVSTSAANEGNTFRYDIMDNLYIFNLGTEGMNTGTYQLNINLEDGTVHTVRISLR